MTYPLVSCIMPTTPARDSMRDTALRALADQTYPHWELIIEDGHGSIGAKRNRACERASGEWIAHWDDDDWSHPERLMVQYQAVTMAAADVVVCGFSSMPFFSVPDGPCVLYRGDPQYIIGTSLFYRRDWWEAHRFLDRDTGEDQMFLAEVPIEQRVIVDSAQWLMVARCHGANTASKDHLFRYGQYREVDLAKEVPLCPFGSI